MRSALLFVAAIGLFGCVQARAQVTDPAALERSLEARFAAYSASDQLDAESGLIIDLANKRFEQLRGANSLSQKLIVSEAFKGGDIKETKCRRAAFVAADRYLFESKYEETLAAFGQIVVDIEKDLVSLGGKSISEFLLGKTKSQVQDAIKGTLKDALKELQGDTPPLAYQQGFSLGARVLNAFSDARCGARLRLHWDKVGQQFDVWVSGDCAYEPVKVMEPGTETTDLLGKWVLHLQGSSDLVYDEASKSFRALIRKGQKLRESLTAECKSQEVSLCPDDVKHWPEYQRWPEACGTGQPPDFLAEVSDPLIEAEGLWRFENRAGEGDTPYSQGVIVISKGHPDLHFRKLDSGWTHFGVGGNANGSWSRRFGAWNTSVEGNTFSVGISPFSNIQMSVSMHEGALRGRWSEGANSGVSVWRAQPPLVLKSVRVHSGRAGGDFVSESQPEAMVPVLRQFSPPICGAQMAGNCPRASVEIVADNIEGPHDLWIDPATHIRMGERRYVVISKDGTQATTSYPNANYFESQKTIGARIELLLWDGATPGVKTLWIDGHAIPFELQIIPASENPT
ncbi:hypothetical protein [Pseudomarimonas arenosa]|uniref:Uncharacterized protein n=1 Tax=Pseudomarimonas arenosa TaxID=2774145 RepID=A0AAW3ZT65_9GAMM|nr:hypothetical protein [Pseudomarimonas arenosa]MBD8527351.1 hypothetical protein [Pseudomarimonas arenosa]